MHGCAAHTHRRVAKATRVTWGKDATYQDWHCGSRLTRTSGCRDDRYFWLHLQAPHDTERGVEYDTTSEPTSLVSQAVAVVECLKETVAGLATNAYEGLLSVSTAALEKDLHAVDADPGLTAAAPVPRECSVDACLDEGAPTIVVFLPCKESFYGSPPPPNFPLTKSPVLKPASGRISRNTVPLATPTLSFDSPFHTRKYVKLCFFMASFLVSSGHGMCVKRKSLFCF